MAPCAHLAKLLSKLRSMPFSVQLQDHTTLYLLTFLELALCGLGPDLVGIHFISLAARYRAAACSNTLRQGLEKIQAARGHNCAPIFALSPNWEKEFLAPSMAWSTANAFDIVCSADRDGKLEDAPQNKQKLATGSFRDKLYEQDFAVTVSVRASKSSGSDQSLSSCGHPAPHETCFACFSSWAHCWFSTHSLQWAMHCSKIPH